jgi:hypothetical protein
MRWWCGVMVHERRNTKHKREQEEFMEEEKETKKNIDDLV